MTSLSLVGGFNLSLNGLLPQGTADGAALFSSLFGQAGLGDGGSFVNEVRSAPTSAEKCALINAYAQGFAAASGQGGFSPAVQPQPYPFNQAGLNLASSPFSSQGR